MRSALCAARYAQRAMRSGRSGIARYRLYLGYLYSIIIEMRSDWYP